MATRKKRTGSIAGMGVMSALLYTRVSSDEQAKEGLSLPAQLQAARRYAADKGWIIAGEYEDVLSGKRDDRPGYQHLLTEARRLAGEGRPVAVIVMRLDRFGRRLEERIARRRELREIGVTTHSVREGGEVSDLTANFLAVLAEEEVERLGDRIRDTRVHNETNGWHVPGRPPFGYRLRPATDQERRAGAPRSVLVPDEQTAPIIREAFRRVASGEASGREVTTWVATMLPERRVHHSWTRLLLRTASYAGRFEDGAVGRWEPLVDQATWDAVQVRTAARAGQRGPSGGQHLLTGVLRCWRCGSKMSGWLVAGKYRRYRCGSFSEGGAGVARDCKATAPAGPVDDAVTAQVTDLLAPLANDDPQVRRALERQWAALRTPGDAESRDRARLLQKARRDAADARRRLGDAARLLVDGTIDKTAYQALADAEQRRLESAEQVLASPAATADAPQLPPLADALALLGGWQAILATGPTLQRRELLRTLIRTATPARIGYGKYAVQVVWTDLGQALEEALTAG